MDVRLIEFETGADIERNIRLLKRMKFKKDKDPLVLVLPELWHVPFDNEKILEARAYEGLARSAMSCFAKENAAYVIGGTICHEHDGKWYNTCFVYDDKGKEMVSYSKMHLLEVHARHDYFESDVFEPGNDLVTFMIGDMKCGLIVCYDIRFPELTRLLAKDGIECLFVPAAFNEKVGEAHWEALIKARAIENEIYVAACAPQYSYGSFRSWGHSMIIDPFGRITDHIDAQEIKKIRRRMPLWKQRKNDLYEVVWKKKEESK